MFTADQYQLLDAGAGRRLERFGQFVLDRPAPMMASHAVRDPALWSQADARFERAAAAGGAWRFRRAITQQWLIRHGDFQLALKCGDSGAVGVYPEQAVNWDWMAAQVRAAGRPVKVLNLFAYTGGSTLAAVAAGARVVHVDAAANVVQWARHNAQLSGLAHAPIRWLVEDARRFVEREWRREVHYDGVILDPPSYGHGPRTEPWKLKEHLEPLVQRLAVLTRPGPLFLLLTCHTPGLGPGQLTQLLLRHFPGEVLGAPETRRLFVRNAYGQRVPSGVVARWPRD